jgi:hypothetical protein
MCLLISGQKAAGRDQTGGISPKSEITGLNFPENGCNFRNYQGKQVETGSMPTACTANRQDNRRYPGSSLTRTDTLALRQEAA